MRYVVILVVGMLLVTWSGLVFSAEKADYSSLLTQAKTKLEDTAAKVGNYPEALTAIDGARTSLKKAEQAYDKGRQWMGLGNLKPEAEQEVRHHLQMVDLATQLAVSRAVKGKNVEDAAAVEKQMGVVKTRVKLLDERKQREDVLRQEAQKCEVTGKELAAAKETNGTITKQIEQVRAENKKLQEQLAALSAEKSSLIKELESLKKAAAVPVPAALPALPAKN
mgnify:FL=1